MSDPAPTETSVVTPPPPATSDAAAPPPVPAPAPAPVIVTPPQADQPVVTPAPAPAPAPAPSAPPTPTPAPLTAPGTPPQTRSSAPATSLPSLPLTPNKPPQSFTLPLPVTPAGANAGAGTVSAPVTPTATPAPVAHTITPPSSNRGLNVHYTTHSHAAGLGRDRSDSDRPAAAPAVAINHNSYSAYPAHTIRWVTDIATGNLVPVIETQRDTRIAGQLSIRVRTARNLYKTTVMGSQDPFCELVVGPNKIKTSTHRKGGTDPRWEYNCNVKLKGSETQMTVHVYHDGSIKNEKIGSFKVQLRSLLQMVNPNSTYNGSGSGSGSGGSGDGGYMPPVSTATSTKQKLHEKEADADNYVEAWFALGRDNSKVYAGEILLRLQFSPDFDAPLVPETLTAAANAHHHTHGFVGAVSATGTGSGGAPNAPAAPTAPNAPPTHKPHMSAAALAAAATGLPNGGGVATHSGGGDQKAGLLTEIRGGKKLRKASNAGFFSLRAFDKKKSAPALFGGTLKDAVANATFRVPDLVFHCVEYLRKNGLDSVGLFRVPGSQDLVNKLKSQFDKSEIPDLVDVTSTATLLKLYLRELKESLIPATHYSAYLEIEDSKLQPPTTAAAASAVTPPATASAAGSTDGSAASAAASAEENRKLEKYRVLEASIARENRDLLHYLTSFLYQVSEHSAVNKMDIPNLAIVFAPTVIRAPPNATPQMMVNDTPRVTAVMRSLIQYHNKIFVHTAEADLLSK